MSKCSFAGRNHVAAYSLQITYKTINKTCYFTAFICRGSERRPKLTKALVFECQVSASPGLPGFWKERKALRSGWGVSSIGPCLTRAVPPRRAGGLPAPQPAESPPQAHRLAARDSAASGLCTWWKQEETGWSRYLCGSFANRWWYYLSHYRLLKHSSCVLVMSQHYLKTGGHMPHKNSSFLMK